MSFEGFKKKSEENYTAGEFCEANHFYSGSINRYYYSLFQFLIAILEKEGYELTEEDKKSKGTHGETFKRIRSLIEKRFGRDRQTGLYSHSLTLTELRAKADYSEQEIEIEEIKKFKLSMNKFKKGAELLL